MSINSDGNFYLITARRELPTVPGPTPSGFRWTKSITYVLHYTDNEFPPMNIIHKGIRLATNDSSLYTLEAISWIPKELAASYRPVVIGRTDVIDNTPDEV